jgi:type III restriction enzyme
LHLICETKGGNDLALLCFPHEKRKIICALKYFAELGVDYDFTTGENPDWWKPHTTEQTLKQLFGKE